MKTIIYSILTFILLCCFIIFGVIGVYKTENGIVLGKPEYEKRDIAVTKLDRKILLKLNDILDKESHWSRDNTQECKNSDKYTLFCALKKASIEINGKYIHRQAALQEVRFAIDDFYKDYWHAHRLVDFNSNKKTNFADIKKVISVAFNRVEEKLKD